MQGAGARVSPAFKIKSSAESFRRAFIVAGWTAPSSGRRASVVKHPLAARQRASYLYAVRAITRRPAGSGHASALDDATVHKKDSTMNGHAGMLVANPASV